MHKLPRVSHGKTCFWGVGNNSRWEGASSEIFFKVHGESFLPIPVLFLKPSVLLMSKGIHLHFCLIGKGQKAWLLPPPHHLKPNPAQPGKMAGWALSKGPRGLKGGIHLQDHRSLLSRGGREGRSIRVLMYLGASRLESEQA